MVEIKQAVNDREIAAARELFREYEKWLAMDLCFQGFEAELAELPGKYDLPAGRLLLATVENALAGCIAMRPLENEICEMKRLFVRDAFRGQQIGKQLVGRVIDEAKVEGYSKMRLDTYPPRMGKAVSMYESFGFRPIPPYYHNPHQGVLFMELDLS